jgi:PAS domain S-box-containing protein
MQHKCATLAMIERAKGALMVTYGLDADEAFDLLRFHSQTRNVKLRDIAAGLTTLLSSSPTSSLAITKFDRLIDHVTHALQTATDPADDAPTDPPEVDMASLWAQIDGDRRARVTPRAEPTAPSAITIAANTREHPLVYANDGFAELTGYPNGEVLGRNCRFLQGAATDPRDIAAISRGLHTGRDISVVIANYRSDGSVFANRVSISPIRNRENRITHYVGTQIEVTRQSNPAGGHHGERAGSRFGRGTTAGSSPDAA